ncbi:Bleomycin resistance protein [compost metagenome]
MANAILSSAIPQLPTGDIEKTANYFVSRLGFEVAAKYVEQKFLIVKRGAAEIHFWQTPTENEATELGSESSCYIRVQNINALFAEFKEKGATFRYELKKQPWGMNEMQIDDPYMNAIRFGESFQ